MLGYSKSATLVLLHLFLLLGPAHGAPALAEKRSVNTALRVARDGENLSSTTTVQTTDVLQTAAGTMIQTCTITLEPFTGDNGDPLVRETKQCTVSMQNGGNNASGSSSSDSSGSSTSSTDASAATSTDSAAASSTDSASNASATGSTLTVSATSASATDSQASATDSSAAASATDSNASATSAAASASSTGGAIDVNGTSLVPGSALSTGQTAAASATNSAGGSAAATSSAAAATGGAISPGGFSSIAASVVATESVASGTPTATGSGTAVGAASSATSAADNAETSAAKFQLPGTKLSVLPIGLGVFAGISVIALIVVGLVTYERTKYRKAFRQRKLAESGAAMGYGGMAQAA